MGERATRTEMAALRTLWRDWMEMVALCASGRGEGSRRMQADRYRALHAELMEACDASLEGADERDAEAVCALRSLAEPWPTLQSVSAADRKVLLNLLDRCRKAESFVPGYRKNKRLVIARTALVVLLFIAAAAPILGSLLSRHLSGMVRWAQLLWRDVWLFVDRLGPNDWPLFVGLAGGVAVLVLRMRR